MHLHLLDLLGVMAAAWAGGRLAARLGYPSVLGELLAGILLGPAVLGLLSETPAIAVLADLGVLLMMLYIGMEVDPAELRRASWAGLLAAAGGFAAPFLLCFGLARWWGHDLLPALFLGVAAGVTALAVNSRILVDLDLMQTRLAHVLMAAALATDTLCLVALGVVLGAAEAGGAAHLELPALAEALVRAVLFFAVAGLLARVVLPRWGRSVRRMLSGASRTAGVSLALFLAVGFAQLAEAMGLHGLVGAFLAGMLLREPALGRELAASLRHVVHDASIGFLAPLFFVTAGFAVQLGDLRGSLGEVVLLVLLATAGKVFGTMGAYALTGRGWREGLVLGAAMNGRGAVEVIVAGMALEAGLIDGALFTLLVVLAMLTTATVPLTLRWGVRWLRARGELVVAREGRSGTVIVGASDTAIALGKALEGSGPLCLVDSAEDHCRAARAAGLEAVHGSALDVEVLEAAGAGSAAVLIAVTPNASLNALVAETARRRLGVPTVHLVVSDRPDADAAAALRHLDAWPLFGRPIDLGEWDQRLRRGEVRVEPRPGGAEGSVAGASLPLAVLGLDGPRMYEGEATVGHDELVLALAPTAPVSAKTA